MAEGDHHGELAQEIEILREIYLDDLKVTSDDSGQPVGVAMTIHPATGDDDAQKWVCLTVQLLIPKTYPNIVPKICICNPRGITENHVARLQQSLENLASLRCGGQMLFDLLECAKESLTQENLPVGQCMICLDELNSADDIQSGFTRTACYHYFHCDCLYRYVVHCRQNITKQAVNAADNRANFASAGDSSESVLCEIPCPVCREQLPNDLLASLDSTAASFSRLQNGSETTSFEFVPSPELVELQRKMSEMFQHQLSKGGIIDIEAEKNKFLVPKEGLVIHLEPKSSAVAASEAGQSADDVTRKGSKSNHHSNKYDSYSRRKYDKSAFDSGKPHHHHRDNGRNVKRDTAAAGGAEKDDSRSGSVSRVAGVRQEESQQRVPARDRPSNRTQGTPDEPEQTERPAADDEDRRTHTKGNRTREREYYSKQQRYHASNSSWRGNERYFNSRDHRGGEVGRRPHGGSVERPPGKADDLVADNSETATTGSGANPLKSSVAECNVEASDGSPPVEVASVTCNQRHSDSNRRTSDRGRHYYRDRNANRRTAINNNSNHHHHHHQPSDGKERSVMGDDSSATSLKVSNEYVNDSGNSRRPVVSGDRESEQIAATEPSIENAGIATSRIAPDRDHDGDGVETSACISPSTVESSSVPTRVDHRRGKSRGGGRALRQSNYYRGGKGNLKPVDDRCGRSDVTGNASRVSNGDYDDDDVDDEDWYEQESDRNTSGRSGKYTKRHQQYW